MAAAVLLPDLAVGGVEAAPFALLVLGVGELLLDFLRGAARRISN